jgi:hypothetical protein
LQQLTGQADFWHPTGIADLASLAMRRLCERLKAGKASGRPASRANRAVADPVGVGAEAFGFLLG